MKKRLLLVFFIISVIIFGLGASFMEYQMLNGTITILCTLIGGIGTTIFGIMIVKK